MLCSPMYSALVCSTGGCYGPHCKQRLNFVQKVCGNLKTSSTLDIHLRLQKLIFSFEVKCNLGKNKIEGTPILELAMIKELQVKKFVKKSSKKSVKKICQKNLSKKFVKKKHQKKTQKKWSKKSSKTSSLMKPQGTLNKHQNCYKPKFQ